MPTVKNGRVVVTALGGPEVLKYVEEDLPEPGPGEVRVKVLAAGVAFADVLMRRGLYPGTPPPPFFPDTILSARSIRKIVLLCQR